MNSSDLSPEALAEERDAHRAWMAIYGKGEPSLFIIALIDEVERLRADLERERVSLDVVDDALEMKADYDRCRQELDRLRATALTQEEAKALTAQVQAPDVFLAMHGWVWPADALTDAAWEKIGRIAHPTGEPT